MKRIFSSLRIIIFFISLLVFLAGIVLIIFGLYDFALSFGHLERNDPHQIPGLVATGMLKGIDLFLMAIVFFILSIGIIILFNTEEKSRTLPIPDWLRVKNFVQLKIILWEAILTTLVVASLTSLIEKKASNIQIDLESFIIPGIILLIAMSLYFMKKGEH